MDRPKTKCIWWLTADEGIKIWNTIYFTQLTVTTDGKKTYPLADRKPRLAFCSTHHADRAHQGTWWPDQCLEAAQDL